MKRPPQKKRGGTAWGWEALEGLSLNANFLHPVSKTGVSGASLVEKRRRMILSRSLAFNKSRTKLDGLEHKHLHSKNYYQEEVGNIASPQGGLWAEEEVRRSSW